MNKKQDVTRREAENSVLVLTEKESFWSKWCLNEDGTYPTVVKGCKIQGERTKIKCNIWQMRENLAWLLKEKRNPFHLKHS